MPPVPSALWQTTQFLVKIVLPIVASPLVGPLAAGVAAGAADAGVAAVVERMATAAAATVRSTSVAAMPRTIGAGFIEFSLWETVRKGGSKDDTSRKRVPALGGRGQIGPRS